MSEEYSIKFWLFWLTFVSIHHSNSNNHRQLMNTHAAALSAGAKFETAAVRQEQLPHWLSPKGIKEPAAGELFTASTAIKQVIGDVVIDEQQLKEQRQQNQQYSTLAHVDNMQQHSHATLLNSKASSHRNGIFQDEEEYLDETEQSEKEFLKQLLNDVQRKDKIKTKISLQQLLRQHEETIKKFNDTGGQYAEQELHISSSDNIVNGPSPVLTEEEEEQLTLELLESILKADMANVPAIPNDTNRFKPTKNSNKIEMKNLKRYPNKQQTIDSLDQELKENLQKFLKISKYKEEIIEQPENKDYKPLVASSSDISSNLVASNTTYTAAAAAVATTKKRNAPIIATTTTTPHNLNNLTRIISSAATPFSSLSVSPFSSKPSYYMFAKTAADVTTPSAATTNTILISGNAATASTADVHSLSTKSIQQQQHVTPMERRHIIPEKLHYTREIAIKQGRLMGIKRNFHAFSGLRDVDQYLGLPYAEAPTGSRRFMPPGAPLPWQGLKIAHHLPPVCPQKLPDISLQGSSKMSKGRYKHLTRLLPYLKTESEDCLYLNVYVPSDGVDGIHASFAENDDGDSYQQQQHLYPVIVYIHGESFEWNSGNAYDGGVLASYGEVIVVTVNYRLGILGFMRPSINENTVANFGLLDQIAALHWIKENIGYFGGDKDKVTLMGHTTGAACINYLMVSPVASGLFHRAVLMSGSAMSDWAATNHSLQLTMQIAHALNCPLNDDNEEMLSCLRQKRYQDILKIPTSLSQFSTSLGPIVDGHVIPNQPYKVMGQYTEHFNRYDLLFGITESEAYHSIDAVYLEDGLRENQRDNLLRFYMQSRFDVRPDLALAATLKKYSDMYNNPIKATNLEHRDVVLDILSDARIVGPLIQTGLFHAEVNRRNYMYVFGHNTFGGPHASLPHSIAGEELAFVFGAPLASVGPFHGIHYTAQEKLLAEAIMSYWCNFAKTGNPKAPWKGTFINLHALEWDAYDLEWPEFNKRTQAYMNIGIPPSVGYKYRQIYMNFWNKELPDELNDIANISLQQKNYENQNGFGITSTATHNAGAGGAVITGHMNKFGSRDNNAEDPVRTLKLLLQEPDGKGVETAENMYNAPPSSTYGGGALMSGNGNHQESLQYGNGLTTSYGFMARTPAPSTATSSSSSSVYGIRHYNKEPYANVYKHQSKEFNSRNYMNENNKDLAATTDGTGSMMAADGQQEQVAKSETTLQLLIGLIIVFIILNVIIYSSFLIQKKKKTKTMQRKLGGILSYEGTTDDDLKRSKCTTQHSKGNGGDDDANDSYIMDAMRKSNTYEAVKTERSPINGFKITRQLSCSTVDTHTKVSEWISTTEQKQSNKLLRRASSNNNSNKSSSFSSLRGSGSFGKPPPPHKISVAIDATSATRGSSVMEQEPIEITKMKQDGRNIIICQDVEVEDQELLTPQDSLDNSRYTLMRQHSTVTEACEAELSQPLHQHSRSDPVDLYYIMPAGMDEKITSFISTNYDNEADSKDVNVTSKDDQQQQQEPLTPQEQLDVIKRRRYPKVLPTFMRMERETDSPPMTKDLSTTYKRNSLPPNSFLPYLQQQLYVGGSGQQRQQPPLPPPRMVSTLGRKPSPARRNSNNITTSPLMLAKDCTEEEDEPEITENTLIVGSLKPKEGFYSTLRRKNKPPEIDMKACQQQQQQQNLIRQHTIAHMPALLSSPLSPSSVFQSFESKYETPERDVEATQHVTQKVFSVQPPLSATPLGGFMKQRQHHQQHHQQLQHHHHHHHHQPYCFSSAPSTPSENPDITALYAQPIKKSSIPRIVSPPVVPSTSLTNTNAISQEIHSNEMPTAIGTAHSFAHSILTMPTTSSPQAESIQATPAAASSASSLLQTKNICKDTTNFCQASTEALDNNQVLSTVKTLKTPESTATAATLTSSSLNPDQATKSSEQQQTRIPQLHRNVLSHNHEQQQQHTQQQQQHASSNSDYVNKDKTNANSLIQNKQATNNSNNSNNNNNNCNSSSLSAETTALTSIANNQHTTASTSSSASSSFTTSPTDVNSIQSFCSSSLTTSSEPNGTSANISKTTLPYTKPNLKTTSIASASSTDSSASSASATFGTRKSDCESVSSSASSSSSSTGTVRTELMQHHH